MRDLQFGRPQVAVKPLRGARCKLEYETELGLLRLRVCSQSSSISSSSRDSTSEGECARRRSAAQHDEPRLDGEAGAAVCAVLYAEQPVDHRMAAFDLHGILYQMKLRRIFQ